MGPDAVEVLHAGSTFGSFSRVSGPTFASNVHFAKVLYLQHDLSEFGHFDKIGKHYCINQMLRLQHTKADISQISLVFSRFFSKKEN